MASGAPLDRLAARLPELLPRAIRWVEQVAAELAAEGRPLTPAEAAHARDVGVRDAARVRLIELDTFPQPADPALAAAATESGFLGPSAAGLALGHTILIRRGCFSQRLLRHELRHVHQVETAGSVAAFLARYLEELVTVGYREAPLEIDARAWEPSG